jgi:hypothetical protein
MNLHRVATTLAGTVALAAFPLMAWAGPHDHDDHGKKFKAELEGFNEVPLALSSPGGGHFKMKINPGGESVSWELSYEDLGSAVQQAHIHFGSVSQAGGISVFLCTNLPNAPAPPATSTQACPPQPATISGTFSAVDVIGPSAQGIAAGEFDELIDAIRAGFTYANVHTTGFAGGEIRGQIKK